ncbi:hypothetical protein J437_LFUL008862 [Ladona fulva]|uniref:NHR domain-containing protein n=1 Tax=Ladona fulva TaxID=123851 RepID=A0A8K0K6F6_LADFU|nr:hypothetical protein J437_LFUL008862 [Ladona fulva]
MCASKYVLLLCAFLCFRDSVHGETSQLNVLEENVITIESVLDESGEWEDIRIEMDPSFSPNDTSIEVKRSLLESDGKKKVVITLALKGSFDGFSKKPLRFHTMGGRKMVVTNDGLTAKRIDEFQEEGKGAVLTNRALVNDELFQVRIDRLIQRYSTSIGIGVTRHNLKTMDYPTWVQCGVKMVYNNKFYEDDSVSKIDYGPNLKTLKVGDLVGVMKKRNGDLHFFVNGKDLGVTATGINYPVHGVLDLYGNAVQATLVP